MAVNLARIALIILGIAQGRYQDALVHGLAIMADTRVPHGSQVLPEVVEAAVRSGAEEPARTALDRLGSGDGKWTPGASGSSPGAQALVAEDDPDSNYQRALELLGTTYVTTEWLARICSTGSGSVVTSG